MEKVFVLLLALVVCGNAQQTLRAAGEQKNIFIGAASNYYLLTGSDATYSSVLAEQYSLVTPENSMKWAATEPANGVFNFTQGDTVVAYAKKANQVVRGHNLCWGASNPSWLLNGNFTPAELQQILQVHINTEVSHYKGQLYSWDVVNEAVLDNPTPTEYLKTNIWYPAIPNYVDLAFQWARAADPTVKLFYNDYGAEGSGNKSDAVYNMLKSMKARGIPVDGVGLQYHVSLHYYPEPADVVANIQRLAALGLEVHITEMDVAFEGNGTEAEQLEQQASIYKGALLSCLSSPSCKSFETWGFTDKYTWLGSAKQPLPWNVTYEAKPAVGAILEVLN